MTHAQHSKPTGFTPLPPPLSVASLAVDRAIFVSDLDNSKHSYIKRVFCGYGDLTGLFENGPQTAIRINSSLSLYYIQQVYMHKVSVYILDTSTMCKRYVQNL